MVTPTTLAEPLPCPAHCPSQTEPRGILPLLMADAPERASAPFGMVGLSFRTAPLEIRGRFAIDGRAFVREARNRGLKECVVLATCNRLEVYFAGGAVSTVVAMLAEAAGMESVVLGEHLYEKACGCAACHVFRVASGMDSAVLGETEIVAQVKAAWAEARDEGMVGPMLDLLVTRALEASKRVRTETELCRAVTSTASLAVRTVRERLGGLAGRRAVVLGAGQIARRLVLELRDAGAEVAIVNRTVSRAEDLATLSGGGAEAYPLEFLEVEVSRADAVFAAATVAAPLLTRDLMARASARRGGWPLPVVDMGVPPNVETGVPNAIDIDALTARTAEAEGVRLSALAPALTILDEELARFHAALAARTAAPTIRALVQRGDEIRARNVEWARERLSGLSEKEMRVVEEMARRLTIGLLEAPIDGLKGELSAREHRHVVEQLFGLEAGR